MPLQVYVKYVRIDLVLEDLILEQVAHQATFDFMLNQTSFVLLYIV